jgi:beta-glucosidase
MAQATFHFPRGFLWGTATSSHQVEGNNTNNNWYAWENEPGRIVHGDKAGLACDWWNGRWREDLDRAADHGQNAHRFSVEWSRIQPEPERWDEGALDHYLEIVRGLHERNMTPMVTLHHFTDPLWLGERGGWENSGVAQAFESYVSKVVETLKDYVNLWITINEPNVLATLAYLFGVFPPGKKSIRAYSTVTINLLRAHAAAYRAIHRLQPQARVSLAINYRGIQAGKSRNPLDRWMANYQSRHFNDTFAQALLDGIVRTPLGRKRVAEVKGAHDFLGVNYYTEELISFTLLKRAEIFSRRYYRPGAEVSESGFAANEPQGLYKALEWGRQFNVPMIITENGIEDKDDRLRPRYLAEHIYQAWRAINFNWPVKGYFHWSLVDNFEWERGWEQRFGLWELDIETQARKKRPSADLYAEICRENGLSADMVARYAPGIFAALFPN